MDHKDHLGTYHFPNTRDLYKEEVMQKLCNKCMGSTPGVPGVVINH